MDANECCRCSCSCGGQQPQHRQREGGTVAAWGDVADGMRAAELAAVEAQVLFIGRCLLRGESSTTSTSTGRRKRKERERERESWGFVGLGEQQEVGC